MYIFAILFMILASTVPLFNIAQTLYLWQNYRENSSQRLNYFHSKSTCYIVIHNPLSKASQYFTVSVYVLLAILGLLCSYITIFEISHVPMMLMLSIFIFASAVTNLFVAIPLEIIRYQTQHICITEDGVSIRSTIARVSTSPTSMQFTFLWPDGKYINWDQLENIRIVTNTRHTSDIKEIILIRKSLKQWDRGNSYTKVISIPGSHPDIQNILRDIREYASDKFKTS